MTYQHLRLGKVLETVSSLLNKNEHARQNTPANGFLVVPNANIPHVGVLGNYRCLSQVRETLETNVHYACSNHSAHSQTTVH